MMGFSRVCYKISLSVSREAFFLFLSDQVVPAVELNTSSLNLVHGLKGLERGGARVSKRRSCGENITFVNKIPLTL